MSDNSVVFWLFLCGLAACLPLGWWIGKVVNDSVPLPPKPRTPQEAAADKKVEGAEARGESALVSKWSVGVAVFVLLLLVMAYVINHYHAFGQ